MDEKIAPGEHEGKAENKNSQTADNENAGQSKEERADWWAAQRFPCAGKLDEWKLVIGVACGKATIKESALYLAENGFPVLPCNPIPPKHKDSKRPLTTNGVHDATCDLATVAAWWDKYPNALIGFPTGAPTGVLVVDVDSLEGHDVDGVGAWRALESDRQYNLGIRTRIHESWSHGQHIIYAFNYVRPIGCPKPKNLPKGIEIKGTGGLIIFPPSRLTNGRAWSVMLDERPAAVPRDLLDIIEPSGKPGGKHAGAGRPRKWSRAARGEAERELNKSCADLRSCPEGRRDDLISHTPCVLHIGSLAGGGGLDPEEALARLLEAGAALGAKNLEKIRTAFETGMRSPAEAPRFERGDSIGDYLVDKNGDPLPLIANWKAFLRSKGFATALRLNEMMGAVMVTGTVEGIALRGPYPRRIKDSDIADIMEFAARSDRILETKPSTVWAAVDTFARDSPFHPFRDWLEGLRWDGQPRLGRFLPSYFGTVVTPYMCLAGTYFIMSIVARAYRPGAKVDYLIILEGGQGIFKSKACRALISEQFFAENLPKVNTKDAMEGLVSKALIEIAEVDRYIVRDVDGFKAFATQQSDHFRASYGHYSEDHLRSCVFIGTTNRKKYVGDPTGGRRFWGVQVGYIDIEALTRDGPQLFAEGIVRVKNGKRWWPTPLVEAHCFRGEQDKRQERDDRETKIGAWIIHNAPVRPELGLTPSIRARWDDEIPRGFTLTEIWEKALAPSLPPEMPFQVRTIVDEQTGLAQRLFHPRPPLRWKPVAAKFHFVFAAGAFRFLGLRAP
jgi:hypothetical protein